MSPKSTRKLVQESLLHPSEGFTDGLMEKLALQAKLKRQYRRTVVLAGACCALLLLVVAIAPVARHLSFVEAKGFYIGLKVSGGLFVFLVLNQLLAFRASLQR